MASDICPKLPRRKLRHRTSARSSPCENWGIGHLPEAPPAKIGASDICPKPPRRKLGHRATAFCFLSPVSVIYHLLLIINFAPTSLFIGRCHILLMKGFQPFLLRRSPFSILHSPLILPLNPQPPSKSPPKRGRLLRQRYSVCSYRCRHCEVRSNPCFCRYLCATSWTASYLAVTVVIVR